MADEAVTNKDHRAVDKLLRESNAKINDND